MTNRDLLKEIHKDNKAIKRNIQQLINVGLIGLLGNVGKEVKKNNDETGKKLVKVGLALVVLDEIVLFICDVIDYKKSRIEDRLDKMKVSEEQ